MKSISGMKIGPETTNPLSLNQISAKKSSKSKNIECKNKLLKGDNQELIFLLERSDVGGLHDWISNRSGEELDVLVRVEDKPHRTKTEARISVSGHPMTRWVVRQEWFIRKSLSICAPKVDAFGLSLLSTIVGNTMISARNFWDFDPALGKNFTRKDRLFLTKLMLERGANPNFPAYAWASPVESVCFSGYTDCLKELVQHGCLFRDELIGNWREVEKHTPDWKDRLQHGRLTITPAIFAACNCHIEALEYLVTEDPSLIEAHEAFPHVTPFFQVSWRSWNAEETERVEKLGGNPKKMIGSGVSNYSVLLVSITKCPMYAFNVLRGATLMTGCCGGGRGVEYDFEAIELDLNEKRLQYLKPKNILALENGKKTSILEEIVKSEEIEYFDIMIIRKLLLTKWDCFAHSMIKADATAIILFNYSMLVLLMFWPWNNNVRDFLGGDIVNTILAVVMLLLAFLFFSRHTYYEFVEFSNIGFKDYFTKETDNWVDIGIIVVTAFILSCCLNSLFCRSSMPVVAVILGSFEQILFLVKLVDICGMFQSLGPLIVMLKKMVEDVINVGVLCMIVMLAIAQGLAVLIFNFDADITILEIFPMLYMWLLGDWDLSEVEVSNLFGSFAIYSLFFVFTLVLVIVILNMIIAKMGNTYSTVDSNAELEWLMARAKLVLRYEHRLSAEKQDEYFEKIKKMHKVQLQVERSETDRLFKEKQYTASLATTPKHHGNMEKKIEHIENKIEEILIEMKENSKRAELYHGNCSESEAVSICCGPGKKVDFKK